MLGKYRHANIRNGLVGHWRPSRGATGNTLIDSVRGNHGTLTNGPTWQASDRGYALSFDGTNDYVLLPTYTYFTGSTPYSICGWFNLASLGVSYPMVFSNNGQIEVRMNSTSGRLEYLNGGSQGTAANAVSLNVWYSFALTWNGSTISLYQNGVAVASAAFSSSISPSMTTTIGGRSASFPWPGLIDDLAIYSRGLTQSEALTLYTAGRGALDQRVNVPVVRGASGQTVSLGRATETENAISVSVSNPNVLSLGRATETEAVLAFSVSNPNVVALGRATEAETARDLSISNPNVLALGRATETETANSVTVQAGNAVQLGRATETESVQSLTISNPNTVTLGRATETESARSLSVAIAQSITIGRATETEVARSVTITTGSGSPSSYFYQFLAG